MRSSPLRVRALAFASLAVLLTSTGMVTAGASAAPGASSSPAADPAASLLVASDLPAGMTSQGITDGSKFAIDPQAFADNGGLVVVNQIWQSGTQVPVAAVFDFRFAFPSAEAARAYLSEAEAALSEAAASGLSLVQDAAPIGEDARHYAGQGTANGATVDFQNFLFRVGSVDAKVFVAGFGLTAEDAATIARAAAARMATLAGGAGSSVVPGTTTAPSAGAATAGPSSMASPALGAAGIHQWAVAATASSEYSPTDWSAARATGAPDVLVYGNDPAAWAPAVSDGTVEWLELTYAQAVVPTAVDIHESYSPGFVTKVEAMDGSSGAWMTLWQGTEPTRPDAFDVFSPPLEHAASPTSRVRISIDTSVPGWNEIDAVELVSAPAPAG